MRFAYRWDEDAQVYVGKCIDLGIYSQGRTLEEAKSATEDAVDLYSRTMVLRGLAN